MYQVHVCVFVHLCMLSKLSRYTQERHRSSSTTAGVVFQALVFVPETLCMFVCLVLDKRSSQDNITS